MYQIIKDGKPLARLEKIRFVKSSGRKNRHGGAIYEECEKREAQGVAIKGKAYNLIGRELAPELETVVVCEVDSGDEMTAADERQTALAALLVDVKYKQTLLDLGVSENA